MSSEVDDFDPGRRWRLNERVSLRDETFGALAYHHLTRRLVFLKSRELVDVVRRLGEYESADAALEALVAGDERERYVEALSTLWHSDLLSG